MSDEEDTDTATKINCGIWMTLDLMLNKESSTNVWDKNEPILKPLLTKKKDRLRLRSKALLLCQQSPYDRFPY